MGTVLEFGGHARALRYRVGQATKRLAVWAPLLFSEWLPLEEMKAFTQDRDCNLFVLTLTKAQQGRSQILGQSGSSVAIPSRQVDRQTHRHAPEETRMLEVGGPT